jgi:outer membrane protein TolC
VLFLCAPLAAQLPSELTLDAAVERALARHGAVAGAAARIPGAEALVRQAGLAGNPTFILQMENWRFTGNPGFRPGHDLDLFAYLTQPFQINDKRARRIDAARQDSRLAEIELALTRWKVRQDVRRAFWTALAAQRQLELLAEAGRTFQKVIDYHRIRVEQGAMAEADLIKVRLEGERIALSENAAAADADRTRLELLRAMGETDLQSHFRLSGGDLPPAGASGQIGASALFDRARAKRHEVLLAKALVDRARAQLELQHAQVRPDATALFGYKRTAGFDTLLAGVSVPLPVFNRNQGHIAYSMSEVDRAQALLRAALAHVDAEVALALAGLRRRRAALAQMETGMLDRAEESWKIALAAYQEGGFDLLRMLDAQRARQDVQLLHSRAQADYRLAMLDLEAAVGEENLPIGEDLLRASR